MTRGKYAAKAANRLAQLDSQIIDGLRSELDVVKSERDQAQSELDQLRRDIGAEARKVGAKLAAADIRRLTEELRTEREQREAERERICDEVFGLLAHASMSLKTATDIAVAFGQGHRVGKLWAADDNRMARRTNAAKANWISQSYRKTKNKGPHVPRSM